MDDFHPFSTMHWVTLAVCVVSIGGACVLGRRWRDTRWERTLRVGWASFTLLWQVMATVWWLLPANYSVQDSFPIHVCDVAAWLAPVALVAGWRWPRTMLYFLGIGFSTQAFVTPVVTEGPTHPKFWLFWVGHVQIVGSAIYLVVAMGYRPKLRDAVTAIASGVAYVVLITPLNFGLGTNYGYVGRELPEARTVLDHLGGWPGRMFILVGGGSVVILLMWVAWPLARALGRALPGVRVAPSESVDPADG